MGIKLEDIFTCDPFSIRGREALSRLNNCTNITPDVFFKEIYAEPYFCRSTTTDENEAITAHIEDTSDFMDDYAFSAEGTDRRVMQGYKDTFEQRFFSKVSNSILLLRGASGSGKSTYLNYLKRVRSGKTIDSELESSESTVTRGALQFPANGEALPSKNGTTPSPPWLLLIS